MFNFGGFLEFFRVGDLFFWIYIKPNALFYFNNIRFKKKKSCCLTISAYFSVKNIQLVYNAFYINLKINK